MPNITRRTAGLAGLALAPFWISIIIVVTALEWDFLHSLGWNLTGSNEVNYPSATLRGDFGLIQTFSFAATGLLGATFTIGFRREFHHRILGWVATAGLGLFTVGMLMSAVPGDLPGEATSWHGNVHDSGFLCFLVSVVVAYSASGLALRGNPAWRGWRWLGWAPVLLVVAALTNVGLPGDLGFGIFLALALSWYTVMAGRLLAVDRGATEPRGTKLPEAAAPGLL
jgi:hypothetical protein